MTAVKCEFPDARQRGPWENVSPSWDGIISCVHGGLDEAVVVMTRDQVLTWWATEFKDEAWDGELP